MSTDLKTYFSHHSFGLSPIETDAIFEISSLLELKKGESYLKVGEPCQSIAFVEKGALVYLKTHKPIDIAMGFAFENDWVAEMKSIATHSPSEKQIVALEDCTLRTITLTDFQEIFAKHPNAINIRAQLSEQYFVRVNAHAEALSTLDADVYYQKILDDRPELIQRVPQYLLASYLGIQPQSLSRIRKSLSERD